MRAQSGMTHAQVLVCYADFEGMFFHSYARLHAHACITAHTLAAAEPQQAILPAPRHWQPHILRAPGSSRQQHDRSTPQLRLLFTLVSARAAAEQPDRPAQQPE
eukprot:scaffold52262_cov20-Tisochrysis_lutea.AAC.1